MSNYSVLMSVYYKEKPEFLKQAMQSIYDQTVLTNDFVLVCDGPLNENLDKVISQMQVKFGDVLHVKRLSKNGGLGNALNIGIKECKNELVARMDSDDISRSNRCEMQLAIFEQHQDYSIVSGTVEEFADNPNHVITSRVVPETNEDIIQFSKKRNPFNHPCVMYKKSSVESSGGYRDFYLLEDYYLWIRMINHGYIGYNIQKPLLWMRSGSDMYKRRGGWKYAKSQVKLFKYMNSIGYISKKVAIEQSALRVLASVAPNGIRKIMFEKKLRK